MKHDITDILRKYPSRSREYIIPILQDIQQKFGWLSKEAIFQVGKYLGLPSAKIYGVATFYNQFRFYPKGRYHIQVCRGTACHVLGSANLLNDLENILKIKAGETTKNRLFSLEVVACLGACGLAPVVVVNEQFYSKMDSTRIKVLINSLKKQEDSVN